MDYIDANTGEECDIGDWAFHYLDKAGYRKLKDLTTYGKAIASSIPITGSDYVTKTKAEVDAWFVSPSADPKTNPDLALGCTTDCLAHHDDLQAFKFPTD